VPESPAVVHLPGGLGHVGLAVLGGGVAQHQIAARRERVAQRGHDAPRIVGIGDEMQDRDQQQPGRLAGIDQPPGDIAGQDLLRVAQVRIDDHGVRVARQDGPAVRDRDRDRVDVDVDHPGVRVGLLGDLVHVALGRYARADIEELAGAASPRNRTALRRKSRPARANSLALGSTAAIARPRSWSARKLWLPPSQ